MNDALWHRRLRHFGALRERLAAEGFEVVGARMGRHLRLRVRRDGREGTITCGCSPAVPEHAVTASVQQARRIARVGS